MELESLNCNHCGAPIEVATSANYVTCGHCDTQLRIRRTESSVFTEQLNEIVSNQDEMLEKLERLETESELARLDRQWDREQEHFMITNKHGAKRLPTEGGAMIGAVMAVVVGIIFTGVGIAHGSPIGLFGLVFVAVAVFSAINHANKASEYRRAKQKYNRRRSEIARR